MDKDLNIIQDYCHFDELPAFDRRFSGGDINEVFLIRNGNERWVVKKNEKDKFPEMLAKEFRALEYFVENSPVTYPRPLKEFTHGDQQYLVIEYFEEGENTPDGQKRLGAQLAQQHAVSSDQYGWREDNYIGSLPQSNKNTNSWSDFYANNRLLAQTKQAFDAGVVGKQFVSQMERFCARIDEIFPEEKPALLHGDLWGGNCFIQSNGDPLLYDPAVYFGHREIDIAMTRLFGGFSAEFYESYNESNPLVSGWEDRISYGQLYPNMVHLNLFGPAYLGAVTSIIGRF